MGLENRVLKNCVFVQDLVIKVKLPQSEHSQATMKNLQDGSCSHKQIKASVLSRVHGLGAVWLWSHVGKHFTS